MPGAVALFGIILAIVVGATVLLFVALDTLGLKRCLSCKRFANNSAVKCLYCHEPFVTLARYF